MEILDYRNTVIDVEQFVTLINNARKTDKNRWYGFVGTVNGKPVMVKGIGTWLQRYSVDGLYQPGPMEISVKAFLELLKAPFNK